MNPTSSDGGAGAAVAPERSGKVYNERGVIAESYYELQGLEALERTRREFPLPKASTESTLRAVFQAAEIALLNLTDVTGRAAVDAEDNRIGGALTKLSWARGFHRVMARLSFMPEQLGLMPEKSGLRGILKIGDSPAFREYLESLTRFDEAVLALADAGRLDMHAALAHGSLDNAAFSLLHLARVCNHQSTIWERNLGEVHIPAAVTSYEAFVSAANMREAVYERVLTGDTYFTQFRGLHQIPELLGEEVNDRLEQAIRDIRCNRLEEAIEHLYCVDILAEGILSAMPAMVDSLATSDYHQIRENLGLTSGSHSVCLRFHMFTHLYEQLWHEMENRIVRESGGQDLVLALRAIDEHKAEYAQSWALHRLENQCLRLRAFLFHWRDEHLNLPRNNLGGDSTKSLTGSPDAVLAVKHMRDGARHKDPMQPLLRSRSLHPQNDEIAGGELAAYLDSERSLDSHVLKTTGRITQDRFEDVQKRFGFFANRCPFTPPPRRTA